MICSIYGFVYVCGSLSKRKNISSDQHHKAVASRAKKIGSKVNIPQLPNVLLAWVCSSKILSSHLLLCQFVCPVDCGKMADWIGMRFWVIGRIGPVMSLVVGFGDAGLYDALGF